MGYLFIDTNAKLNTMKLYKILLTSLLFLLTGCYSQFIVLDTPQYKNNRYKVVYKVPSTQCLMTVYPHHFNYRHRPFHYHPFQTPTQCHTSFEYIWLDAKPFKVNEPKKDENSTPRSNYRPEVEKPTTDKRKRKPVIGKRN